MMQSTLHDSVIERVVSHTQRVLGVTLNRVALQPSTAIQHALVVYVRTRLLVA